jgi:hypothetical protein
VTAAGVGGVVDSSTTVATASPSSTCTRSGSAYGGWGEARRARPTRSTSSASKARG